MPTPSPVYEAGQRAATKAIATRRSKAPLFPKRADRVRWQAEWSEFLAGWRAVVAADRVAQTTWATPYNPATR